GKAAWSLSPRLAALGRALRARRINTDARSAPLLRVELLGHGLVVRGERLGVDLGEAHDAHVRVGAPDLRAPEADVLDRRHDAAEERRAKHLHELRLVRPCHALLDGEAERLPDLLAEE